jgi:hypothetical protein
MNRFFYIFLIVISIFVSGCSKNISKNNGNRYSLEPLPFKYSEDGNWGFIDLNGNVIIEPAFKNRPGFFQNGFGIISDDTVSYYINAKGDTIGSYYYDASAFSDKRALIKDKKSEWFFIDESGTIVFKVDTVAKSQLRQCRSFNDGLALFLTSDNKFGYLNTSGNIAIEPKYSSANDFSEELAYVELKNDTNNKVEKFLINTKGEVVKNLDESLKWINPFNEGRAAFKDSSGCGYMNRRGEIVIKQQRNRDDLSNFINGYASYMCGGDWGVIDSTGKKVLSAVYEIPPFFYNGLAIIKENDRYGVINLKGKKVIECLYNHIAYPLIGDRYYVKDGKYYLMFDKTGKQINEQEIYRIDLVSALLYSFKTGYVVIGEKLGISVSNLSNQSSILDEMRTNLNNELIKIYNN